MRGPKHSRNMEKMKKPILSAKSLFMPHSGYTDGMEARYIILYDPFTEHHQCKWESVVEIKGEKHIIHVTSQIPKDVNHDDWLKVNNPQAIEKLETFYREYMKERKRLKSEELAKAN